MGGRTTIRNLNGSVHISFSPSSGAARGLLDESQTTTYGRAGSADCREGKVTVRFFAESFDEGKVTVRVRFFAESFLRDDVIIVVG